MNEFVNVESYINNLKNPNKLNIELLQKGANSFFSIKCSLLNYLNDSFVNDNNENLKLINIAKFIENKIKSETKYDLKYPLKAGIAFPVGLNINNVVAHWSPNSLDTKQILKKTDIIKIDYGIHFEGNIIDSAFSYSYNDTFSDLIKISEEATNKGCELFGEEVLINDISKEIQEIIESYELEINNKNYDVKSVQNLCGHQIKKYQIHGDKMIPNISMPQYTERIKNNEQYAIETYPSTGNGFAKLDYNKINISHYMINKKNYNTHAISKLTKDETNLLNIIYKNYGTLPFSKRWLSELKIKKYCLNLNKLVEKKIIDEYPPYYEKNNSYSAQTEKNIIIYDNKKIVLT